MYLQAEGQFYSTGGGGIVPSYPVADAETVTLVTDDGMSLATAWRDESSGRYRVTSRPTANTLLYLDWQECIADQVPDIPRAELDAVFAEGWDA